MDVSNKGENARVPAEKNGAGKPAKQPKRGMKQARPTPLMIIRRLSSLRMVLRFLTPYKWHLSGGVLALLISTAFTLAIFRSLEWLIDGGFGGSDPDAIAPYFIAVFAGIVILAIATFFRVLLVTLLGERVVADIRKAVHTHLLGMSPAFFETNRPSEIASRLTADTTLIQVVVSAAIPVALRSSLQAIGALVMVIILNPILVGAILGLTILVMLPVFYFGKKVRILSRSSQDRIADVGALANETYGAMQVVQAFTREKEEIARFSSRVESAYAVAKKRIMARSWMVLIIVALVYGFLNYGLWLGAKAVIVGGLTAGELATLLALGVLIASSMASVSEVLTILQRAAGAAGRLAELLATESELPIAENPIKLEHTTKHSVQFESVSFAYPSKPGIMALKDFSLKVNPGQTIAIVGPSGAGKSTVLQLLLRFFDPQEGVVKVDQNDIRDLSQEDLRSMIGFVPQESVIFADSLEANVRFGRPDASAEEVKEALEAACCTNFIEALPKQADTYLGERGVRLSGGQRQRLAIARAILRNAPILLLDEATSSLDSEVENKVQEALERLMKNRTTLVIAHRLSTVRMADKIIVLENGSIVATGTHDELVADGGLYARLAKLQFSDVGLKEAV